MTTEFDAATGLGVFRVRDNGPGIPPDVMPKIFEPFFTTKEDQLRTGLGLAVAKSIVEQHGGEITSGIRAGRRDRVHGRAAGSRRTRRPESNAACACPVRSTEQRMAGIKSETVT